MKAYAIALILSIFLVVGSMAFVIAQSNTPVGRWEPNDRGPDTPSPFPCEGDNGEPGFEFYWDADRDGDHDHIPDSFESAASEPVGCFTAEQLTVEAEDAGHDVERSQTLEVYCTAYGDGAIVGGEEISFFNWLSMFRPDLIEEFDNLGC